MIYKSILQDDFSECYLCGRNSWLEWHHIFNKADKKRSEKYGLMVHICHWCHNEAPDGLHYNMERWNELKAESQRKFEELHSHDKWMQEFGKNYL